MKINYFIEKYNSSTIQFKASLWFLISYAIQKSITLISVPIYVRILSPEEFGVYNLFNSWMLIASVFVTLNIFYGVFIQGLVKFEYEREKYTAAVQGLITTLCFAWTGVYFLFSDFWCELFSLTEVQMMSMLVLIWTNGIFLTFSGEARVSLNYKSYAKLVIGISIIEPLIAVIAILNFEDGVTARIISTTIVSLVIYGAVFLKKLLKEKYFFNKRIWKYVLLFNIPLIPHYLSTVVLNNADRIMINAIAGEEATGLYSLAYTVATLILVFNQAIMQIVEPLIYKYIKLEKFSEISNIAYPLFIFIAFLNILLIAFTPELVYIFASSEYYESMYIIPPIAMGSYFMFLYLFFAPFEFYYEKKAYIVISTSIAAIANIILNFILIPIIGYEAAGYTTLICYIIYAVSHYLFVQKIANNILNIKKIYSFKIIFKISVIFMIIGFIFLNVFDYIYIRYSLIMLIFIAMVFLRKIIYNTVVELLNLKS